MRCQINGRSRNLPDFLIVGAGKSGTTSLHKYLAHHPDVVMPRHKETLFFHITTNPNKTQLRFLPAAITDFESYLKEFDDAAEGQLCGESCPSYLYFYRHTIDNLQYYHPRWQEVKIVVILREPVDKIVSQYFFVKNKLGRIDRQLATETLEEALVREPSRRNDPQCLPDLHYIANTMYSEPLRAYLGQFPNVRVYLFDDLQNDKYELFRGLCQFLGIRANREIIRNCCDQPIANQGRRTRDPRGPLGRAYSFARDAPLFAAVRQTLPRSLKRRLRGMIEQEELVEDDTKARVRAAFQNEVRELEKLLGRDLSNWGY